MTDRPKKRILVVEDEDNVEVTRQVFSRSQYFDFELDVILYRPKVAIGQSVAGVKDAEDLRVLGQAIRDEEYDACVVDLELDDSGEQTRLGTQVIEALAMERPNAPVVAFSAHDDWRSVLHAVRQGTIDFVPKKEGFFVLREAVEKVLRKSGRLNSELAQVEAILDRYDLDPEARFLIFSDGKLTCQASTPFVALADYRERRKADPSLREDPIVIERDPCLLKPPGAAGATQ